MRVTVIRCECSNPKPHRRLEMEIGAGAVLKSPGFFSVEGGRATLNDGLAMGLIEQTLSEKAATLKELEACGLPATDAEAILPKQ